MLTRGERLAKRTAAEAEMENGYPYRLTFTPITVLNLLDDLDAKDAEIERLTILALGCGTHHRYRAKRAPVPGCPSCDQMWAVSQALKEMAKTDG